MVFRADFSVKIPVFAEILVLGECSGDLRIVKMGEPGTSAVSTTAANRAIRLLW